MKTEIGLPNIYRNEKISLSHKQIESLQHSNDKKNNKIIENIESFNLAEEFWKNKYCPLGRLPKLAEYKNKLDMLIYEKFNNPENVEARKKIFLGKKRNK